MDSLIVIGASGHGKVVAEAAISAKKFQYICFIDDNVSGSVFGLPVIGKISDCGRYVQDYEFIVAIGNNNIREKVTKFLIKIGAKITTIIHEKAMVSDSAILGAGTVVLPGAVINASARIGEAVIVNTKAVVEHDCVVGNFSHISVGACLAGTTSIKEKVFIGAGAVVINNINICGKVTVGAGAVVVKDIDKAGVYVGVPAVRVNR